jgi:hypothetical protein
MSQNTSRLIEVGRSDRDNSVLYLDKSDGRLWELIYPCDKQRADHDLHLELRSFDEIADKYKNCIFDLP